jgi:arylformamidase
MAVHNYYSEVIFMSTHTGTHMDASQLIDSFQMLFLIKIEESDELIIASEIEASMVKILEGGIS